jgi:hypothetical protein
LKAVNEYAEASYTMQVLVKDKPQVFLESIYSKPNKQITFSCRCTGYPESKMAMFFTPCHADPKWPTCTASTRAVDNSVSRDCIIYVDNPKYKVLFPDGDHVGPINR